MLDSEWVLLICIVYLRIMFNFYEAEQISFALRNTKILNIKGPEKYFKMKMYASFFQIWVTWIGNRNPFLRM